MGTDKAERAAQRHEQGHVQVFASAFRLVFYIQRAAPANHLARLVKEMGTSDPRYHPLSQQTPLSRITAGLPVLLLHPWIALKGLANLLETL